MSLINDALKRAKEAQPKTPPAVNTPHFKPIEPTSHNVQRGIGLMLPVVLALIALVGLLFVWQLRQKSSRATHQADQPTVAANPTAQSVPAVAVPSPKAPEASPTQLQKPTEAAVTAPAAPAPVAAAPKPPEPVKPVASSTPPPTVTTTPPQPVPLRLQAIFYNPTRPSAIISGKTVGVGEIIGEFRVRAIAQETVTLASSTRTNILSLVR